MLPDAAVKARAVDITSDTCSLPHQLVVDANVLYLWFYPSFDQLNAVNANAPTPRQRHKYPKFYKRLLKAGVKLYTTAFTLAEMATTCEAAELQLLWLTDPTHSLYDSFKLKDARYKYASDMPKIRGKVGQIFQAATKYVQQLPKPQSADSEVEKALLVWTQSFGDFGDAMLVAAAHRVPVLNILSEDADLLSFKGVTLYTANKKAINASIADKEE